MKRSGTFEFIAPLWLYPGDDSAWYFVSVPGELSDDIDALTAGHRRGFGSVRVTVTVGSTTWQTSIFPNSKSGMYMLPVKKAVRVAEDLAPDGDVAVRLELADF